MADRRAWYTIHAALRDGSVVAAADLGLETDARGRHRYSALRYHSSWLRHPLAFPLNPVHAPLHGDAMAWRTSAVPAVIDEVLPGHWQRFVLIRAGEQGGQSADPDDVHATLSSPREGFRVGAIEIRPAEAQQPTLGAPLPLSELQTLACDADALTREQAAELEAVRRLQVGSSVGGARPKVIVGDGADTCIAKLGRANDPFNHPRVEQVCLELARRAGLDVPASRIVTVGDFDALLVSRFDATEAGGRCHLVSANALLKDAENQFDPRHGRYDDIVDLIRRYSEHPAEDLRQLYGLMLLNEAINNIDDHLRNFSFRVGDDGLRLAPAYDLVPSDARGAYPSLVFGNDPARPRPDSKAAERAARAFQLRPREARAIRERLRAAFRQLPDIMASAGLGAADQRLLSRVVWRPADEGP